MREYAENLVTFLKQNKLMLVTAESCTGGLIPALLADIPGCGEIFEMGFVVYSPRAKHLLLGVNSLTMKTFGLTSEEVACEMAAGAMTRSGADISVAITGTADAEGDHTGTVCFAFAIKTGLTHHTISETKKFKGDRKTIRHAAVQYTLLAIPEKVNQLYPSLANGNSALS
jgi:nicotinamide-nucleotide amidase